MQLIPLLSCFTAIAAWPTVGNGTQTELSGHFDNYNAGNESVYLTHDVSPYDFTVLNVYDESVSEGTSIFEAEPIGEVTLYGDITKGDIVNGVPTGKYSVKSSSIAGRNHILWAACCTISTCGIEIHIHANG